MNKEVKMGRIELSMGGDVLTATGVGSCVVITLYDTQLKIGAMAHAMLPSRNGEGRPGEEKQRKEYGRDTRYVGGAIDAMLIKIKSKNAKREDLEAKIIGGANMFFAYNSDIGKENVLSAKEILKKRNIRIVGECVDGSQGRSVEFSPDSGVVTVKTKF